MCWARYLTSCSASLDANLLSCSFRRPPHTSMAMDEAAQAFEDVTSHPRKDCQRTEESWPP